MIPAERVTQAQNAIDGLTALANATTKAGDSNITDAMSTLIDGYNRGGGSSYLHIFKLRPTAELSAVDLPDGFNPTGGYAVIVTSNLIGGTTHTSSNKWIANAVKLYNPASNQYSGTAGHAIAVTQTGGNDYYDLRGYSSRMYLTNGRLVTGGGVFGVGIDYLIVIIDLNSI